MNATAARYLTPLLLSLLVLSGAACGKKDTATAAATGGGGGDMEADLARTTKEQSDFYKTRPIGELPANLTWENGATGAPEFADVNAKKGGTFNYFIADFPRTLRTIGPDATGGIREFLLDFTQLGFIHQHPNEPEFYYGGLASEWAVDRATKTLYVKIDPAAKWSDGKPITTDDVVFTFYFMRSPHLTEPWYNDFYTKTYKSVTVYDSRTFAITANEFKPDFAYRVGGFVPYPRHAFQDFGPGWLERFQWRIVPTTGPYTLAEKDIVKGQSVTFTRLDSWWAKDRKYWRGMYNPDKLRLEVIRDPDKVAEAFLRGDIDLFPLNIPKYWYETVPDDHPLVAGGYIVKTKFFNRIPRPDWGLWINTSKSLLDNLDVRLGINYAANFDLVCTQFYRGDAVRPQTRSDGYAWKTHPTLKARPFDPILAREHFAKAGFTQQGPDGVLRNASGQRLSFTITTYANTLRDMLPILKQEALKAGLEFNLEVLDQTTGWKKVQEKNHEIGLVAISRSPEAFPRFWEMHHGSNAYEDAYLDAQGKAVDKFELGKPNPAPKKIRVQTNNMTETFIPELDNLIEQYDKAETLDQMKALTPRMEELIHNNAAWVPGWAVPFHRAGYQRYVKWPKDYNVAQSRYPYEFFIMWIDQDEKRATEEAKKANRTFPRQILTFDQFKG